MPQFRYRAVNSQGRELEGTMSAADANAAVVQLSRQGLRLRSIDEAVSVVQPAQRAQPVFYQAAPPVAQHSVQINSVAPRIAPTAASPKHGAFAARHSARSTYNDRQFFFAQLGGLLRTGISPADALHSLLARSSSGKFRDPVNDMAAMCASGMALSDAMEHYPNMFTPGIVGAVRAGENGGYLPDACETISEQQKQTRRIFNWFSILMVATPYAVLLTYFSLAVAAGINRGFEPLIDSSPSKTGTFQQGMNEAVFGFVGVLFIATIIAGPLLYFWGRSLRFRPFRHSLGLGTPMFKRRALNENLSHFSYHLGRLAKAGLSPFASWNLAAQAVPNQAYAARLTKLSEHLNENTRLSELLHRSKLFPTETAQLVETGEITGDLPRALDQVMEYGREREKQANLYIGIKAGCWTSMLFVVGGMIVLMIVYLTYITNLGKMMQDM